jgi:hypothetical protein
MPTKTTADWASSWEGEPGVTHEHAWLTSELAKSHKPIKERTKATCMTCIGIPRIVSRFLSILMFRLPLDRIGLDVGGQTWPPHK